MRAPGPAHPLVLAYHSVAPRMQERLVPSMITLTTELAAHVSALREVGRRILTAGQLAEELGHGGSGADVAVLTFDDGWADALTVAAPLLASLDVQATFFLCPGLFGNPERSMSFAGRMLRRDEAAALHAAGMELAAHSMTHPDLTAIDDRALAHELSQSKLEVEALTSTPCRTVAYPFGRQDARVQAAAADAGFALAFTYQDGPWHAYAAPRLPVPAPGVPLRW
ncbi:MAG: polysaccharide deacetylase [Solirubrobacterales bacterium]|nr:polysaccharide deacetylase [Solirubrobacterales bacterium]